MVALTTLEILVIDDHEAMRTLLLKVLNRAGAQKLRSAPSALEALALLEARPAQLLLVDQMMPGMDGTALVAHVRADARWQDARIIMITGRAEQSHIEAGLAAGANAVLVKPVTPRDLLQAIDRVMAA